MRRLRVTSWWRLTVTVIAVVALWRHRRRRPRLHLVPLAFGLFGWNPIGPIIDGVSGFFSGVADDVKAFVKDAITSVTDWISGVFDKLENFTSAVYSWTIDHINAAWQFSIDLATMLQDNLTAAFLAVRDEAALLVGGVLDQVRGWVSSVYSIVSGWVDAARGYASDLFHSALDQVGSWVSSVYDIVRGWVDAAWSAAMSAVQGALEQVNGWIQSVYSIVQGWVDAALGKIADVFGWVTDQIGSVLSMIGDLIAAVIDPVWTFLYDHVIGPLEDLQSFVWDELKPVYDAIIGALDWLLWLVTMPFQAVIDFVEWVQETTGRQVLDRAADAHRRHAAEIIDRARRSVS